MNSIKKCPVCGKNGITTPLEKCPQCDSDLECFNLLNSLNEPSEASNEKRDEQHAATLGELKRITQTFSRFQSTYEKNKRFSLKRRAILILCIVGILFLYHAFYVTELFHNTGNVADALRAVQLSAKKQELNQRAIIRKLDAIKLSIISKSSSDPEHSVSFRRYTLKEKETIWDVAKRFYGDSVYYPVLLEHNPELNIYSNSATPPVRILENASDVKPIYDRLVIMRNGQKSFKYRCRDNDAWEGISLRFYGHIYGIDLIKENNPSETNLTPSTEIYIPLKD